jgi:hypothetical protein
MNSECWNLLVNLAKRNKHDSELAWYSISYDNNYYCHQTCLICNEEIHSFKITSNNDGIAELFDDTIHNALIVQIEQHGMHHLKESNLLPFL